MSWYIIVGIFVNPGISFHNFILKISRSRILVQTSIEFELTLWIRHSSSDSKLESLIVCGDTDCLEMLIVLHICLFFMSNGSSDVSLVTLRLSYRTFSLKRCIVIYLWVNLIFICIIHLMVRILNWTTNEIFHITFWHLKVTQSLFFLDQPGICQFTSLKFHVIPDWFPCLLSQKNYSLVSPRKIFKFYFFPGDSSSLHQGTETGCFRLGYGRCIHLFKANALSKKKNMRIFSVVLQVLVIAESGNLSKFLTIALHKLLLPYTALSLCLPALPISTNLY